MAKKRSQDDPQLPGAIDAATGREPMLPVRGEQFGLMTAPTAAIRMQRLCRFIEYWLGPRLPEYGEPPEVLETVALPEPLRLLYAFAGRWPAAEERAGLDRFVPALTCQDYLLRASHVEIADDGRLEFLCENQYVWKCRTLPTGDDPHVWCVGVGDGKEPVGASLSRFLVTFVLQELCFNSRSTLSDEKLDAQYELTVKSNDALWLDGTYAWEDTTFSFHLWNRTLVLETQELRFFAAGHPDSEAFLLANQSHISSFNLRLGESELDVRSDGAGRIRIDGRREKRIDPGKLDFANIRDMLLAQATDFGNRETDPMVFFQRSGQGGGARGRYIHDRMIVRDVFAQALRAGGKAPAQIDLILKKLGL